jgi:hypothetical protein
LEEVRQQEEGRLSAQIPGKIHYVGELVTEMLEPRFEKITGA